MANTTIAVITGASRGLGLAILQEFAAKGWQVIGTGRSEQPGLPAGATYKQFDAGDADACAAFWKELKTDHPDATICLINNAGGYISGGLTQTTTQDYMAQMQSCYFSSVYMTHSLATNFAKARIVNIISTSALAAHKNNSAYGAAKAAQMHFFQSIQNEFTPEQYKITNLYPSDIASHGENPAAIGVKDLARFVREQAENNGSYYVRDVTIFPTNVR